MVCQPLFCIITCISFDLCIFFVYIKYLCFFPSFLVQYITTEDYTIELSLYLCCFSFNIAWTKLNHNVNHIKKTTLYIVFKWKVRGRTEKNRIKFWYREKDTSINKWREISLDTEQLLWCETVGYHIVAIFNETAFSHFYNITRTKAR